jgi:predicted dehydrogenase
MLNFAIVGIGWWGQKLINSTQGKSKFFRFTEGVSKEPDSVLDFCSKNFIHLNNDLQDVLENPNIDAIVLATPHSLHVQQIIACAHAGKAVFCEKPLALHKIDAINTVKIIQDANVLLKLGTNKRFWSCMSELDKLYKTGIIGKLLHIEGHYSNENTGRHFSEWRTDPNEAPAAGLTGAGLHVLDALVHYAGPVKSLEAKVMNIQPQPNVLDTLTVMFEFESRVSGTMATIRSTPFYWRIHLFGDMGSLEALSENELIIRLKNQDPIKNIFPKVDTLLFELNEFAINIVAEKVDQKIYEEMISTVDAFEKIVQAVSL